MIIAHINYDKNSNAYKAITEEGKDVTKQINDKNKLKYAYTNKRVIIGIKQGKNIKKKKKKTDKSNNVGYDWRTREDIEEELQREINKTKTKYYINSINKNKEVKNE